MAAFNGGIIGKRNRPSLDTASGIWSTNEVYTGRIDYTWTVNLNTVLFLGLGVSGAGAYRWSDTAGFGTAYSGPSPAPPDYVYRLDVNPQGNKVAFFCADFFKANPTVHVYNWSYTNGFGTKHSAPTTQPTSVQANQWGRPKFMDLKFRPVSGNYLAMLTGEGTGSSINYYAWDNITGFGTKVSNSLGVTTYNLAWTPTGDTLATTGQAQSSSFFPYAFSNSGIGNLRFTNTTTPNTPNDLLFTPDGNQLILSANMNSFTTMNIYAWSETTGMGSKYTTPTFSDGGAYPLTNKFTPRSTAFLYTSEDSPYINAYAYAGPTVGTKYSNPSTLPASGTDFNSGKPLSLSPMGISFVMGHNLTGTLRYLEAYRWNDSTGFGTKFTGPSASSNIIEAVSISPTAI